MSITRGLNLIHFLTFKKYTVRIQIAVLLPKQFEKTSCCIFKRKFTIATKIYIINIKLQPLALFCILKQFNWYTKKNFRRVFLTTPSTRKKRFILINVMHYSYFQCEVQTKIVSNQKLGMACTALEETAIKDYCEVRQN